MVEIGKNQNQFFDLYFLLERQAQLIKQEQLGAEIVSTYELGGGTFKTYYNTLTQTKQKIIIL